MVAREYPRGLPITEKRIYQPGVGKHPNAEKAKWVGKDVTVIWVPPRFDLIGVSADATGHAVDLYAISWVAWVHEFAAYVPASFLHNLPKAKK